MKAERPADEVPRIVEHLFRERARQMVAVLGRIFGLAHLDLAEDVVQEALVRALATWPHRGVPADPGAWVVRVARNRALDVIRRRANWRGKVPEVERAMDALALLGPEHDAAGTSFAAFADELRDDQLRMIFACCHEELSRDSQIALTLKVVCALGVEEIARALLARPATVAQRIVRAKRHLRQVGARLDTPSPAELPGRLDAVLEVVYLLFNEGYSATRGDDLVRRDLCREAIRLVLLLASAPAIASPRVHALAALLLFHGARLDARVGGDGLPILLADQDRSLWHRSLIDRGVAQLALAGRGERLSRYHLEAEIAACHALAPASGVTDWRHVLDCYDALAALHPTPVVALNRAVAVAEVEGPEAGLTIVEELVAAGELARYPPLWSTRGLLLERCGRHAEAASDLERARSLGVSAPAGRFLEQRF